MFRDLVYFVASRKQCLEQEGSGSGVLAGSNAPLTGSCCLGYDSFVNCRSLNCTRSVGLCPSSLVMGTIIRREPPSALSSSTELSLACAWL